MNLDNFRQMYVTELQELRSVEDQLTNALPKMVEAAGHSALKQAMRHHLDQTRSQRDRLDMLLQRHGASADQHKDQSMQSMIGEADKWMQMAADPDLRDAGLIASAQRVEHYEIAVYGTLCAWAKQLGLDEDASTLHAILDEEKMADKKLTQLAESGINPDAMN